VKLKPYHTLIIGIVIGAVAGHLYHTKTQGPGTRTGTTR
jgi:hypothetical protein